MPILLTASFAFGAISTVIIFLGVAVDRHGNGLVMPKRFHSLLERNSHPLLSESANADAGLRWFQQHNVCRNFAGLETVIILVTVLLGILWLPGGIFSFRSEYFARTFLGILTAEYLLFSWLCGMRAATTEVNPPGNQLGTLLGVLPVTDTQIASQALRTGIRTHIPATVLMVVIQIVVWVVFRDKQVVGFLSDNQPTSLVSLGVQILTILLIAWIMFATNFWTWLSGRIGIFVWQLALTMLSLYSAGSVGILGKTIGGAIRDTTNAGIGMFLIWSTIWMFRKAKTLRLIDQSLIRKCVLAWLITYALLVAILWFAGPKLRIGDVYHSFRWPVIAFAAATLASLALLPIPGARVATFWNRHRS